MRDNFFKWLTGILIPIVFTLIGVIWSTNSSSAQEVREKLSQHDEQITLLRQTEAVHTQQLKDINDNLRELIGLMRQKR